MINANTVTIYYLVDMIGEDVGYMEVVNRLLYYMPALERKEIAEYLARDYGITQKKIEEYKNREI